MRPAVDARPDAIVVSRRFAAPAEALFDAWFDATTAGGWLFATPGGFSHHVRIDPRIGGGFEIFELRGDTLARHYGVYREIARARRIVFTLASVKEETGAQSGALVTVDFASDGAGAVATLTHRLDPAVESMADAIRAGWAGILDGLARHMGETDAGYTIVIRRSFDAPRLLVWRAWTQAEHLSRWLCPAEFRVIFAENDLRVGGSWRSGMRSPDGEDFIHRGVYLDIDAPSRLAFTHGWEQNSREPPAQTTVTVALSESDGRTDMIFIQAGLAGAPSALSHKAGWTGAFEFLAAFLREGAQGSQAQGSQADAS